MLYYRSGRLVYCANRVEHQTKRACSIELSGTRPMLSILGISTYSRTASNSCRTSNQQAMPP